MCEPATLAAITLAVSATSSVASYVGQRQAANAQEMSARDAYEANQAQLNVQQQQVNEQATKEKSERAVEAMRQRGRLQAIAAEGVGGSLGRLEGEINLATATDLATIERNRAMRVEQSEAQKRGLQAQTQGAFNSIKQPSEVALGLELAGSGLGYLNTMNKLKVPVRPN